MSAEATPSSARLAASPPDSIYGAAGGPMEVPRSGTCAPFVDPALPAPDAPVCWLAAAGAVILDARSTPAHANAIPDIVLAELPSVRHIILDPAGFELVLIRTTDHAVTLRLHGAHAADGPVRLTFLVPGLSSARGLGALLAILPDMLLAAPRRLKRSRRQILMRDALIALDGRGEGASYRDIASVIYGKDRAHTAWNSNSRSLKDRLHRAFNFGKAFRDGGYRALIK